MFEFKLALKYLRKNKIESISIIVCLIISITLILGEDIGVNSLYLNQIKMAKEIAGFYDGELNTYNKKNIEKLKKIDGVYNLQTVKNLGEFVPESGLKTKLYTFNEGYLKSLNYKLIQGRFPKNENEILIDTHVLSKFSNHDILNNKISGVHKFKYNVDSITKLFSEKTSYKVVGLISKEEGYYKFEKNIHLGYIDLFTFIKTSNDKLPNNIEEYSTLFNVKDINEQNLDKKFEYIRANYDKSLNSNISIKQDSQSEISNNIFLDATLRLYKDQMNNNDLCLKIFLAVLATFIVSNVLYIIIKKIRNQIGQLRVLGMSNKKILKFFLDQMIILYGIGLFAGFLFSIIFAKISLKMFIILNMFDVENYKNINLNIPYFKVLISLLIILILLVSISLILIKKSLKQYPIEILNETDKITYKSKKNKTITQTLLKNNLFRNKIKTIMSILIISFSGFMIIKAFSTNLNYIIEQSRQYSGSSGNKFDYVLKHYENADESIKKVDISKLNKIGEIKDLDMLNFTEGYLTLGKNKVNKHYIDTFIKREDRHFKIQDIMTSVTGIDNTNSLNKFVKEGNITNINKSENGYINIAITNSFYKAIEHKYKPVIKNLKIGDIVNLKIESSDKNGNCYYKTVKCKVIAKLNDSYQVKKEISEEFGMRISMSLKNLQQLTNNRYKQRIGFNSNKNGYSKIEKILKNIDEEYDFLRIFNKRLSMSDMPLIPYSLIVMVLVFLSALINLYITISLNFKYSIREFSILRAIGVTKNNLKKVVIYEAITYPLIGSIISIIFISLNELKLINLVKKMHPRIYIKPIYIPPKEGFIFMAIVVLFAFLIGYIKSKSIDNMEIIEGINKI